MTKIGSTCLKTLDGYGMRADRMKNTAARDVPEVRLSTVAALRRPARHEVLAVTEAPSQLVPGGATRTA